MKTFKQFKHEVLNDPELREEYEKLELEFSIARQIIQKRISKSMSQSELAAKIGTKQSAISRIESGRYNPSLSMLQKIASALETKLTITM